MNKEEVACLDYEERKLFMDVSNQGSSRKRRLGERRRSSSKRQVPASECTSPSAKHKDKGEYMLQVHEEDILSCDKGLKSAFIKMASDLEKHEDEKKHHTTKITKQGVLPVTPREEGRILPPGTPFRVAFETPEKAPARLKTPLASPAGFRSALDSSDKPTILLSQPRQLFSSGTRSQRSNKAPVELPERFSLSPGTPLGTPMAMDAAIETMDIPSKVCTPRKMIGRALAHCFSPRFPQSTKPNNLPPPILFEEDEDEDGDNEQHYPVITPRHQKLELPSPLSAARILLHLSPRRSILNTKKEQRLSTIQEPPHSPSDDCLLPADDSRCDTVAEPSPVTEYILISPYTRERSNLESFCFQDVGPVSHITERHENGASSSLVTYAIFLMILFLSFLVYVLRHSIGIKSTPISNVINPTASQEHRPRLLDAFIIPATVG